MTPLPATFIALAVVALAILPGAAFTFAFESRAGAFRVAVPDRLIRFLVASGVIHAFLAGLTYGIYRTQIRTGNLGRGEVSIWLVELAALAYIGLPLLVGGVLGHGRIRKTGLVRRLSYGSLHPRAWDSLFSQGVQGVFRFKLKSDAWIAGFFRSNPGCPESYASGYGEDGDLYCGETVRVDPESGAFVLDDQGNMQIDPGGILIRWAEVEYAQFFEVDG